MTLLEELESLQTKSRRCAVGRFMSTLTEAESEQFVRALKQGTFSGQVVASVVSKRLGEVVKPHTIYRHKGGFCSC